MNRYGTYGRWAVALMVVLAIASCQSGSRTESSTSQTSGYSDTSTTPPPQSTTTGGDAVDRVRTSTGDLVDAVARLGSDVADEAAAAKQTVDVRAALMADPGVDASHISIETDAGADVVILTGTVPTAAQKEAAGRIAAEKADGYRIDNRLTVMP